MKLRTILSIILLKMMWPVVDDVIGVVVVPVLKLILSWSPLIVFAISMMSVYVIILRSLSTV